jgi:hypothetical protein
MYAVHNSDLQQQFITAVHNSRQMGEMTTESHPLSLKGPPLPALEPGGHAPKARRTVTPLSGLCASHAALAAAAGGFRPDPL